jgi:predicted Zn-dependent protease
MPDTIDELYARWKANPADTAQTISLCDALRHAKREDLVEIVGSHAARQLHVPALVAAARMYTDVGRLDDAQSVLLAAGRLAPRDGEVFRQLGEVLLRRGDAERAEKVLERAVQFGASDATTSKLLADARKLIPAQRSSGMIAVADEVAKSLRNGGPTVKKRPDDDSDRDVETLVRKSSDAKQIVDIALGPPKPVPAAGAPPLPPPAPPPPPVPPPVKTSMFGSNAVPEEPPRRTTPFRGVAPPTPPLPIPPSDPKLLANPFSVPPRPQSDPFAPQTAKVDLPAASSNPAVAAPPPSSVPEPPKPLPPAPPPPFPMPDPSSKRLPAEPEINPLLRKPPKEVGGQRVPEPRDVLEALQIAGIFEPDGAVKPILNWDRPDRGRRRVFSTIIVIMIAVLAVGGGGGAFYWVKEKRAREHIEAEAQLARIDKDLQTSDASLLDPAEKGLTHAFDLESRSPHAALTWLHERAMVGFLKGGESIAFEDATARAREVGVEEKKLAFANAAGFLFQNDTAGAASAVAKGAKADDDAWYQLLAGATFERAGDAHALERYEAAARLDPELLISQILFVRAMAVEGDPQKAHELAKDFRTKHPDRIEGAALVALAWARDPLRSETPPPEAKQIIDSKEALPVALRAVPHAARAIIAIDQHKIDEAKPALTDGLRVADTPGVAAWLGSIALATGDEGLARKAALQAVSYSAVYPPARVLAARVALLGSRLDEALKATEDLPPSSPDVAVVTAAVAYEKLDRDGMARALDAISDDAKKLPFLAPLMRGQALLGSGANAVPADKALDMADGEMPWGDIIAIDAALDVGDLELAHKVTAKWVGEVRGVRAARLARLARYDGKNDDAERFSKIALETGTVTTRVLAERVFALAAANKAQDALALFKSYPNVGGPIAKWLRAYALASGGGKMEEARAIASQEDPPPPLAPLPSRMVAAMAYGAMKDTRKGNDYVKQIVDRGFLNPDLTTAAEKVGLGKLTRRR